jgi:diguanylate cyclase (GGDEF)-like protein
MEVTKTEGIYPDGGGGAASGGARAPSKESGGGSHGAPAFDVRVSILGIPDAALTPEVKAAIDALSGEISRLREELDHSLGRTAYLEELADMHPLLPVLNRRAFARELARTLVHVGALGTPVSLLCLHVTNADTVRRIHGRQALDRGLEHVCQILESNIHATDVIGNLGGADFGIVLLVADRETALRKGAALVETVQAQPFLWDDEAVALHLAWGAWVLEPMAKADEVMDAADRQLLEMARQDDKEDTVPTDPA